MKILHLIFSLNVGGAESMLIDIANRQTSNNTVYVYIINSIYNQTLIKALNNNIKVHLFNRRASSRNILKIVEINSAIFKIKPDIIHCHDSNIIDLLLVRFFFKTVLTVHDVNLPLVGIKKFNKVFAISSTVKTHLLERGIKNISIIYNGIDVSVIQQKIDKKDHTSFYLIQVSRLDHLKKGQHILLEALHLLIIKYGISNFHIDFIGEGNSFDYLQDLTQKYGLENKVCFLGLKDRSYIYSHLKEYDLLIQPSIFEGFGLTVAEGMAAKIPVLVSANDGPLEIIDNGQYGFFFKKGDPLDCAEKIKRIIESPDEAHKIAIKGYIYAVKNFNIDETVENYQKEYDIVTNN